MSADPNVCDNFAGSGGLEWQTTFWITSTSARSISKFSAYESEDEFILLPGTKLLIVNRTINSVKKQIVARIEEIAMFRESKYTTEQ
jgi:hypothetical protein